MRIYSKVWAFLVLFLSLSQVACASESKSGTAKPDAPLVQPEYRLQEDRKAFEEVRSQVPADKKIENDDLAFMDQLFSNSLDQPQKIREKFSKVLNKKREKMNKDLTKRRENYVKEERKTRDQFTKDLEAQRNDFKRKKTTPDERKEFFSDIELKRKDFYANQKEKRDEFEAQIKDDRKNFEDYVREKSNDFNARHKEFSEKQKQILKDKKDGKPAG